MRGWRATVLGMALLTALGAAAQDAAGPPGGRAEHRTARGPVTATVQVEPDRLPIGDAVALVIEVTAEAGVELLMPTFGASLERFAILEFVPRETIDAAGRTVATQRYRLQPPASGRHAIPPITIEFVDRRPGERPAPEDEDAYELLTERVEFTVESVVPAGAGDDMKPPLGPLDPLSAGRAARWPWLAAAVALPLGFVVILVAGRRLRGRARMQSAYDIARTRLDTLAARPAPGREEMDGFFVELSDLVRRYLEDRFALHAPELTTEEFLDVAAGSPDLTREHRNFLQAFLRSADQVKFARHVPPIDEAHTALSAVRGFLEQTADAATRAVKGPARTAVEPANA